jgi:hypothetical protein
MVNYNNIVTAFESFADKHLLLEGFSHGAPDAVDVEKIRKYPFLHLVYTGANYQVSGNAGNKTYAFEVYILGSPSLDDDAAGVREDVQTQAVSDIEQIAEDLLADIQQGHKVFDLGLHYGLNSARMTPLTDTRSNLLVGVLLDIAIDLPYGYDACNPPLEGVTPAGSVLTSPVDTGSLTVRENDGSPSVSGVTTIQVTNGALTDSGGGIVTLDLGTGSVQTVNNVSPDANGNVTIETGGGTLDDLTDTDLGALTGLDNGDVLYYASSLSKWINVPVFNLLVQNANNVVGSQAAAIAANTAKTSFPGFGTTEGTALEGNTALLQLGTTSTTALAGDTTTITTAQANAITANTAKTSFPGFGTTAGTALEGSTSIPGELNDLSDATVSSPAAGDVLYYTNGSFQNTDLLAAVQQVLTDSGCSVSFGNNNPGDFNGDGFIGLEDFLAFLTIYGTSYEPGGDCSVNRSVAGRTPGGSARTPASRIESKVNNLGSTFIANYEYENYDSDDDFQLATSKAISEQIELRKTQGLTSSLEWRGYTSTQAVSAGSNTVFVPRMDETSSTITTRGSNFLQQNSINDVVAVGGVSTQAGVSYTARIKCTAASGVVVAFSTTATGVFRSATSVTITGDGTEQTATLTGTVAQGYNDTGAANSGTLKITALATGSATIKYESMTVTITN